MKVNCSWCSKEMNDSNAIMEWIPEHRLYRYYHIECAKIKDLPFGSTPV
jgi:hypothetical protein